MEPVLAMSPLISFAGSATGNNTINTDLINKTLCIILMQRQRHFAPILREKNYADIENITVGSRLKY
jgi:hypothetical protein